MKQNANGSELLAGHGLVKDFGGHKGVFNVTIALNKGEVLGFVGPNGAGKSTTINMLTGLIKPDAGSVNVFGKTYTTQTLYKVMAHVGVMYSETTLDESLTAAQVFTQSQELLGKDCSDEWQHMSQLLELDVTKKIKTLSLGNKKKVGVVHALMHQPAIIIMDEPTSGLDPIIRERFVRLVRQAADNGAAVLLSSHDLDEIQEISDRIQMIKAGKTVLIDTKPAIVNKAQRLFRLVKPPEALMSKLQALDTVIKVQHQGSEYSFQTADYQAVTKLLIAADFYNFYIEQPSLEDMFREYYE